LIEYGPATFVSEVFGVSDFDFDHALRHEVPTEREGLPPGYRMRADAHYVEQLTGRSPDVPVRLVAVDNIDASGSASPIDRDDLQPLVESIAEHGIVQPLLVVKEGSRYRLISGRNRLAAARAAAIARVPCLVHQVDHAQADVLTHAARVRAAVTTGAAPSAAPGGRVHSNAMAGVTDAVEAIRTALAMLSGEPSPLTRRVALDLVRAEAWRASWQLRAAAILEGTYAWRFKSLPLGYVIREACDGLSSECRLQAMDVKVNLVDGDESADFDEEGFLCGVTGAMIAIVGLHGAAETTPLTLTVRRWNDLALAVEVEQDAASAGVGVADRSNDRRRSDRRGGWTASLGAAVARAVAERHGGEATFLAEGRRRAVRLTLSQPTIPVRS
jgi:hypothetical protein